jgi:putative nucleotidyltransferase with HDIG domain
MIDPTKLMAQIDTLAPVPQVVNQVMALADDPDSSLADVAEVIKYDPIMTANMLKLCNSAYYGLPRTVDSIHDATMLLGLDQIVELFIFRCAFDNLYEAQAGYALRESELLRHAVASAIVAKDIAEKLQSPHKHLVFTAALLKDIGKVVLARYLFDYIDQIDELTRQQGLSFIAAEKCVLGVDHAEIGGLVAKHWGFSKLLTEIIRNHHSADSTDRSDQDAAIVYLSDYVCMLLGLNAGVDGMSYQYDYRIFKELNLSEHSIDAFMMAYIENRPKVDALISLP